MKILLCGLLLLQCPAQTEPNVMTLVDKELEQNKHSSSQKVLAEFTAKGGTFVLMNEDAAPYPLAPGDRVFPACSGGNNRSQTLWNILLPYTDKITLMPPHATCYGFDPYNGRSNWQRTQHTYLDDEFISWAGRPKSQKFGWDIFMELFSKEQASPEELARMLGYYNVEYYNPTLPPRTRRVYITFAKNGHIHLHRLNQVNTSLENVVVLLFPLEDLINHPLPEWNTYPRSFKTYV